MTRNPCLVEGCAGFVHARGLCGLHYQRWSYTGTVELIRPNLEARFWAKVNRTDTCWLWTAAIAMPQGYGLFFTSGKRRAYAHRLAYELLVGPIPEGLELDHLCRVPVCVNPAHLEAVTPRENFLRSTHPSALTHRGTCKRGHSTDDMYVSPKGHRMCRPCQRMRGNQAYAGKRGRT